MSPDLASTIFLVVVALLPCVWALVALWQSVYTPWQSLWFFGNVLLARILWRAEVPNRLPIPPNQGAVIVANHRSSVDPFFVQLAARRVVHWMVAKEYFQIPFIGLFLRTTQAIPTRRAGQDTAATRAAIRYAARGDVVGLMPEGRINVTDQLLLPARPGAAMIALTAQVPIIPCYIHGSPYRGSPWSPLCTAARVRVVFGKPIDVRELSRVERDDQVVQQLTIRFMTEIARLAGDATFQPRLAGRRWLPASP